MRNPEFQQRGEVALRVALAKLHEFLTDETVVEIMLNPDGYMWVEHLGSAPRRTSITMSPIEADNLLRQVAAHVRAQLNAQSPSMLCRLPLYGARLQAVIPP
ncbi:MAG TPA: hypothetical protein VMF89_33940, partial [Polyangiales bacterium]|nr:hypothetical protein [Polyangiales bacterium]